MEFTHVANPVRVNAVRILEVTAIPTEAGCGQARPDLVLRLEDGRNFEAGMEMTARYMPVVGDYVVTQEDGYTYLNPKDVFERKYHQAPAADPIEQEIQAKGLTAPRITPADIEANIAAEFYISPFSATDNGADGNYHSGLSIEQLRNIDQSLKLLTICVLVLRNGFTVTGESACASPENFDAEIGRKIARENAINKVWPLMGYQLKQRLFECERLEEACKNSAARSA